MEKIENNVCSIFIDESYRNFTKALNLINNTTDKNINEIYDRVLVISDENVYKTQLNKFIDLLNAKFVSEYIVPAGEESKCIDTFEKILEHGLKAGLTRKSLIIAVGGGVVGDLSGYVAASYMRGIDFVQVPTTLLAQVDSSIGGKTGINLGTYKNVVGAFYQPQFTFINVSALRTLPDREFRNGMSEVVKYGFIYDYEFINYLLENSEDILDKRDSALRYIVKKCAEIKAHVVEVDEKEGGLRKILNFGHTFGHGVEKLCHIPHGEAVSIGMNMAFKLSLKRNLINQEYYDKFLQICKKFNLPIEFEGPSEEEVLSIMKTDKKNSFSKINMILPTEHGKVGLFNDIDDEKILEIIKECKND